jgi:hypothetical protein
MRRIDIIGDPRERRHDIIDMCAHEHAMGATIGMLGRFEGSIHGRTIPSFVAVDLQPCWAQHPIFRNILWNV